MEHFFLSPCDILRSRDYRMDVNYWENNCAPVKSNLLFNDIFDFPETIKPSLDDLLERESFLYCEIGNIDKEGHALPLALRISDMYDEENEYVQVFRKIFGKNKDKTDDIMIVEPNDILIAKTRPLLNKILFIGKNEFIDYSNSFYTTAFIRVKTKNDDISPALGYYLVRNILNEALVSVSRIGKSGYPSLTPDDIKDIPIPFTMDELTDTSLNKQAEELYNEVLQIEHEAENQKKAINKRIKALF